VRVFIFTRQSVADAQLCFQFIPTAIMATVLMFALVFIELPSLFCKSDAMPFFRSSGIFLNFFDCPLPSSVFRLNPNTILQIRIPGIS
jgi:hypothetical protein